MSQIQSQIQKAPIYTREKLEKMLRVLNERVGYLAELLERAEKNVGEIHYVLYYKTDIDIEIVDEIAELFRKLKSKVYDAIDKIIVSKLQLDTDIEKYEKQYNVKFNYETERQLGVVMLKENETVEPVVIWTDYSVVSYCKGERNE